MDFIQPVCELVKCVWVPFVQQICSLKHLKENFENLNNEAQDLYTRKEDVNKKINRDTISKMPSNECKAWLEKVESIENQVNEIEAEFKANKKCISGWCPDIFSRMKLGKHIVTVIHHITTLKEASDFKGGVVVDAPLEIVERTPMPIIEGQTSTDCTVQKILICLRDDGIRRIGVWGMGGVGKTTIMEILKNLPEISQMFEIVIWVTLSKDCSVRKVQNEIAQRLQLKLESDKSNNSVASKLFRKLVIMKYLLLLDDVWNIVSLKEVGVPDPSRENGCKIVLTSRFRDVCNKMDTDEEIKVDVLSKEEAWNLFHRKVGEVVDSPSIKHLAKDVVDECGGLPLGIIVVGGSLRKVSDVHVWRNVLEELRSATFGFDDMEESVFKRLKFSYDRLRNENVKNCFLYCALYPEDFKIPIPELIEHWRVERFIDGVQNLDKAYDKGHTILKDLIDASLLEIVNELFVKMHDVIRDLALRITSTKGEGCRFLVRAGVGIEEYPNKEEWEHAERVSLMCNKLCSLPQSPRCTSLSTLFLQYNEWLYTIPGLFFEHMHSLQVLNLSNTAIKMLPSSLSKLVSLRGLYLRYCRHLKTLPSEVGALKRLEVLHVGDRIQYLPVEIRQLTRLRSLQVTYSIYGDDEQEESRRMHQDDNEHDHDEQEKSRRRMYHDDDEQDESKRGMHPGRILSSLSLLEDLRLCLDNTRQQWDEIACVSMVKEVCSLKQLTSLEFMFPRLECLEHFLKRSCSWKDQHLTTFHISVGHSIEDSDDSFCRFDLENLHMHEGRRQLIWEGGDNLAGAIIEVLNQACGFWLKDHKTTQKLSDFGIENMNELHICVVQDCNTLESIINGNSLTTNVNVFPNLETMVLYALPNLRNIWEGQMPPPQSFTALTHLDLFNCPRLRYIFSRGIIPYISNLERLYVSDCEEIEDMVNEQDEITVGDDDERDIVFLPRLKHLMLFRLPKLVRICKAVSLPWPHLEDIDLRESTNVKSLPMSVVHGVSALKRIIGNEEWWKALEWVDDDTKQHFQSLFKPWRPWVDGDV